MIKKGLFLGGILLLLSFSCCGCGNKSDKITISGNSDFTNDNINLTLEDGYFVKDYKIDYDNMELILRLENDSIQEKMIEPNVSVIFDNDSEVREYSCSNFLFDKNGNGYTCDCKLDYGCEKCPSCEVKIIW